MIPESKLIKNELTLRILSLPEEVKLTRKSLIRWVALSLGLISPNETRRLLFDILEALFYFHCKKESPTTKQIIEKIAEISPKKPTEKAIYYHLLRLKELGIISRKKGQYYLGDGEWKPLSAICREFYLRNLDSSFSRINEALEKIEAGYNL